MDENKKIREVRVVGYSRELLFLQLTMLIAIFSLLGVATFVGAWGVLFVVCFLGLFGFSLFQALRLHRKGVTISICDLDVSEDSNIEDDENPDTISEEIDTDEDDKSNENEDPLDKPHWADNSYPDPDVELGLKNPLPEDDGESAEDENSDVNSQTVKSTSPK